MKLNARCRQVPAASDGVPLIVSIVDQPHAVLPYVAVRRILHVQMDASSLYWKVLLLRAGMMADTGSRVAYVVLHNA